jgi:hypothetical protein
MGVNSLYTIYKIGYTENDENKYITYGLGLGSIIELTDKFSLSIDGSANHIIKSDFTNSFDLLCKADVAFRFKMNNYFSLFAGPSFNIYLSKYDLDSESSALKVPYTLYSENWWNESGNTSVWIGGIAGVSVKF